MARKQNSLNLGGAEPDPIIPPGEDVDGGPGSPVSEVLVEPVAVARHVDVRLAQPPRINPTDDEGFWIAIRQTARMTSFESYRMFIDQVLCQQDGPHADGDHDRGREIAGLARKEQRPFSEGGLGIHAYGVNAYNLLRLATETFLLMRCGIAIPRDYSPEERAWDEARLYQRFSPDQARDMLQRYLRDPGAILPYLEQVFTALNATDRQDLVKGKDKVHSPYCIVPLIQRITAPCLIELIWSYWHEQGMLVQTMNAISMRFQNKRTGRGDRDPLASMEIDPLRPVNNLIWGYIQDEYNRLTVARRSSEYDHHYGLKLMGRAVPNAMAADSRSKFLEAFHDLMYRTKMFYDEDADRTVESNAFPLLNGLREVHLLLAEGAHNQFGDLPWTARVEMLIQQYMLARPEMREFLGGRVMVPYPEPWMGRVDTMKTLQGWTDVPILHFRNLAMYSEQIVLSIRYNDWVDVIDQDRARNWARFWRPEIEGYVHTYRVVTGVDLTSPETVDSTQPAILLGRRLRQYARTSRSVRVVDATPRPQALPAASPPQRIPASPAHPSRNGTPVPHSSS
jgi:hypothetical protein